MSIEDRFAQIRMATATIPPQVIVAAIQVMPTPPVPKQDVHFHGTRYTKTAEKRLARSAELWGFKK